MKDTVYDKYLKIKGLLGVDFPNLDEMRFFKMLGKLESWHYPNKRWNGMELSKEEADVYEWLVDRKYNPSTVYKWYRILGQNKEIKKKVKARVMSFNEAKTYSKPFRRMTELESELMYHIKKRIEQYIVR
ncbi:MAG: hypothetical protein K9N07_11485 [Candidatus Cloacimonetes bacterium]|nr:hypothetical protein [Candidatus Cloacimonadota bacterium]